MAAYGSTLSATFRRTDNCSASYTTPMPPRPSLAHDAEIAECRQWRQGRVSGASVTVVAADRGRADPFEPVEASRQFAMNLSILGEHRGPVDRLAGVNRRLGLLQSFGRSYLRSPHRRAEDVGHSGPSRRLGHRISCQLSGNAAECLECAADSFQMLASVRLIDRATSVTGILAVRRLINTSRCSPGNLGNRIGQEYGPLGRPALWLGEEFRAGMIFAMSIED